MVPTLEVRSVLGLVELQLRRPRRRADPPTEEAAGRAAAALGRLGLAVQSGQAERHLVGVAVESRLRGASAVCCDTAVAVFNAQRRRVAIQSIPDMRRGYRIELLSGPVRVRRPRFGWRLAFRALTVDGPGWSWQAVPDGPSAWHVVDPATSRTLYAYRQGRRTVDPALPCEQIAVAVLLGVRDAPCSGSLLGMLLTGL